MFNHSTVQQQSGNNFIWASAVALKVERNTNSIYFINSRFNSFWFIKLNLRFINVLSIDLLVARLARKHAFKFA